MFHKVIVGFDDSERGLDALMLGKALVAPEGELIICCVHHLQPLSARIALTEPAVDRTSAQESVERVSRPLEGTLTVTPMFVAGASAAEALQSTAIAEQADLIVLGSSHRGAIGRVFLGSVTQETLRGAPCPVAIAPVGFRSPPKNPRFSRIVAGYDVAEPVSSTLSVSVSLCEQTGAELHVVAVADDAAIPDPTRATMPYDAVVEARLRVAEHAVAEALTSVPETVSAISEVRDGDPAEQLLEAAHGTDLLVLGSHGRGALDRLIMGSVCNRVVRAASCAVLVVPPTETTDLVPPDTAHSQVTAGPTL